MFAKLRINWNPIIIKELRSRMRGGRAFVTLTVILLGLGVVSYLLYRMVMAQMQYTAMPASPQIGQALFTGLAFFILMMVCAVTPAVTASAISSEKEKLTYEMLVATPLRPASLLWGKLMSAMSYVFILIFAAIPLFSVVFTFGGVAVRDMLKAVLVLVVVAAMLGVIGLFFSALLGRSGRATVVSYVVLVVMLFLPYFIYMARTILTQTQPPRELLVLSPITTLFSAMSPSLSGQYPMSWFWMFGGFGPDMILGSAPVSITGIPRPLYHYSLPIFLGIAVVLYLVAMRLVRPSRRWNLSARELAFGTLTLVGYVALVAGFFYLTADRYENAAASVQPAIDVGPPPLGGVMVEPAVVREVIAVPAEAEATPTPYPGPDDETNLVVPVTPGAAAGMRSEQQAEVYAAVVKQLYYLDHTYSETPNFPVIYLVEMTDDSAGDPSITSSPSNAIPSEVQEIIEKRLLDLPAEVRWTADAEDVPRDPETQMVAENGALITLGNIHLQEEQLLVAGSIETGMLSGGGRTYSLENLDGQWQITGFVGEPWLR